ncbi:MAG: hypothetical protein KA085_07120 [Phenylobacterium sp.]|jgi:hypothetical protein|uniref:hypothetical protein n=1 Tax=Phenylobacterium sp. TaxID=1871053 RepID=UPI001B434FE4|nr:hypothetical protein [Phenylobacterium sp.]MBP7648541.1 hypothetical protein [Phenylobacterium sp.]MBP7815879.1 hypothetical protein [Phenylobacterium sp.]MBP9232449.1 hypothetical protein [Phenylobacterium sp.]MBP9753583.1 hypothetical protein [Phenylobacterium sp.]
MPNEMDLLPDAIVSPFDDEVSYDSLDADVVINDRRARAENAETMRLVRAL